MPRELGIVLFELLRSAADGVGWDERQVAVRVTRVQVLVWVAQRVACIDDTGRGLQA